VNSPLIIFSVLLKESFYNIIMSNNGEDNDNEPRKSNNDVDEEEARDTVSSLKSPQTRVRQGNLSDITSMISSSFEGYRRERRVMSDISQMVSVDGQHRRQRTRQKSSSDVLVKLNQRVVFGYDDLKLAEQVSALGTKRERIESGLSDKEFLEKIEEKEEYEAFDFNYEGLTSEEAERRLAEYGPNELPEKVDPKWLVFLRQFWAPMPIMIWVAIIIELGLLNFLDMAILLVIQFANASISFYETNKAGNAIAALKSSLKPSATCKRDGEWKVIDASLLVPGDTVILGSGSAIPADCRVNNSEIDVDQAALTGESLPV
jgi:H+-transporting ATPase